MEKMILTNHEPGLNPNSEELANILVQRLGLMPRKKGSTEKMHRILIELYERAKNATRKKEPTRAVMSVEEMGYHAGITRQTMYEYLRRWLELDLITKTSYIDKWNKVIIGYKLNGMTIEQAFERSKRKILNNLDNTQKYITELQKLLKNEKISRSAKEKNLSKEESKDGSEEKLEDEAEEISEKEDLKNQENIEVV